MEGAFRGVQAMLQDIAASDFSVVVPVRITQQEHAENLDLCVDALLAARPAPGQILVVDDGSIDPIGAIEGVSVVRTDPQGPAGARNAGSALAGGKNRRFRGLRHSGSAGRILQVGLPFFRARRP